VQTGLERCHLAIAYAQLGDREPAARCVADAAAHAGEVRVARNAARIHRALLGDADAGARVLAACAAELLHRDATVDEWHLLAAGWLEAGDRDTALHYLAHAASAAATVDELCAVAEGYSDAGDPAAGHAAVVRARDAAGSVLAWTTIARASDALADVDGVSASLTAAEAVIVSPADAAAVAHAWVFHSGGGGDDEVDRCFARGVALAGTEEDGELLLAAWARLGRPRSGSPRCRRPRASGAATTGSCASRSTTCATTSGARSPARSSPRRRPGWRSSHSSWAQRPDGVMRPTGAAGRRGFAGRWLPPPSC